jgi:hypothetical protein
MEALSSIKTLVLTRATRRNIPQDAILQSLWKFTEFHISLSVICEPDNLPMLPDNLPMLPDNLPMLPGNLPMLPGNLPMLPDNLPMLPDNLPMLPCKI